MTFREFAENQGLFVTTNNVVYFEKYEMTSDFVHEALEAGIVTEIHEGTNYGKTTYAVVEKRNDSSN
jgi:cytosine/adenosine deaminase-related metal-dependent hydrolase